MSDQTLPPTPTDLDPAWLGAYRKALEFACARHTEFRKGDRKVPYLTHLLDVSSTVLEDGGSLEAAIAGLLHDVVEDQHVPYEQITTEFGDRVAAIVRGCTDSGELAPGTPKAPYLERRRTHPAGLRARAERIRAGAAHPEDVEVLTVTAADKLSNLRATLGDLDDTGLAYLVNFKGGLFVTHWYYATVIAILTEAFTVDGATEPTSRAVRDLQRELPRLTAWCREVEPGFVVPVGEDLSADDEDLLVRTEAVRAARAAAAEAARAAVERLYLDCYAVGGSKHHTGPFPAEYVDRVEAALAAL